MTGQSKDDPEPFPARLLRPDERQLVADWLAAAGDVASAFVSERRSDGQGIYRRIVITVSGDTPTHLIDAPTEVDYWIVLQCRPDQDVNTFSTLREALNFVRPVLLPTDRRGEDETA